MSAIGLPLTRPDGPAKVTGAARYVADTPVDGLTHAALVMSSIPAGRVTGYRHCGSPDGCGCSRGHHA